MDISQGTYRKPSEGKRGFHRKSRATNERAVMNIHKRLSAPAAIAALTAGIVLLPATSASAAVDASFGQHVRVCAQTMGFSGTHNPGMHQGASDWNELPCDS